METTEEIMLFEILISKLHRREEEFKLLNNKLKKLETQVGLLINHLETR